MQEISLYLIFAKSRSAYGHSPQGYLTIYVTRRENQTSNLMDQGLMVLNLRPLLYPVIQPAMFFSRIRTNRQRYFINSNTFGLVPEMLNVTPYPMFYD